MSTCLPVHTDIYCSASQLPSLSTTHIQEPLNPMQAGPGQPQPCAQGQSTEQTAGSTMSNKQQQQQQQQQQVGVEQEQQVQPPKPQHEHEQQPQEDPQLEHEHQCHICMGSMTDATAVKGCGHQFCHSCIRQWVNSRQQPCCPVCRAEVKFLVLADGTEQEAEPAAAVPPAEAEPDLSCLDHSYFLAEVSRLLSRAECMHNRVYRDAYGCGRKGACRQTGLLLEGVQDVLDTLTGYRSTLQGEVRFDPQVLLQELYRLDRQLTSLHAGSSADADSSAAASNIWQQHPADSFDGLHIHDDDDPDHDYDYDSPADDDCWHHGLSRTPGRRPTQRNVKHARSNSGSNQQQQQQQGQQLQQQARGRGPGR